LSPEAAPAPAASGVHFAWLDPLRGFAALSVLAAHLVMLAALPIPTWYPVAWFRIGFLGVDLFFAISGAVILLSLAALQRRHGDAWRRPFAWRRLARIVPLYLLTCAAFVLLVRPDILQRPDAAQVVLAHLFFVQNLFPSTHGVINGPSWTLGVEMQFYALMLLAGPWLLRMSVLRLASLGVAVGVGWRALVWWRLVQGEAEPDTNLTFIWSTQLPGVIDEFVGGMVAARWWMQRRDRGQAPGARAALGLGLAALLAWAAVIAAMHAAMPVYWTSPWSVIGLRSGFALAAGLSVAAVLACPAPRHGRSAWRLGGDLSYGIYLWHMGVLLLLQGWLSGWSPWAFGAAVLGLTLLLSGLGWFLVERPAMRRVRATTAAQ
jgi:peptidoglycan/LPS O-acetylase OafA/YrhL